MARTAFLLLKNWSRLLIRPFFAKQSSPQRVIQSKGESQTGMKHEAYTSAEKTGASTLAYQRKKHWRALEHSLMKRRLWMRCLWEASFSCCLPATKMM